MQNPQRGNRFSRALANFFYKVAGWRIRGSLPDIPKYVIIGAPHTSNWDFLLAMNFIFARGVHINWMAKKAFFWGPFAAVWRWLGGFPVERQAATGIVEQTIAEIKRWERFVLALSPEGTRQKVHKWRTGFYHIAYGANIPIVPVTIDYGRKTIGICPPFTPTGDVEADIAFLQSRFAGVTGKYPDQF